MKRLGHRRGSAPLGLLLLAALVLGGAHAAQAACPKGQVRVRGKTPVRRGPGLNYAVERFLEVGRCARLEEVSVDGRWTLLRLGEEFGWVPTRRLDAAGQASAQAARAPSAPVGSGTSRAFSTIVTPSVLRARPQPTAEPRRVLPIDVRVLPLQVTADGAWVEVRDDRGDTGWVERAHLSGGEKLAELPATGSKPPDVVELEAPVELSSAARLARRRVGARDEGVHLTVALFGAAVAPMQRLDTDGEAGIRRYDLGAVAGGGGLDVQLTDLGPITARVGWTLAFISGVSDPSVEDDRAVGGTSSALSARAGWPIAFGDAVITPEVGYAFDATRLDVALPGDRVPTFVSSEAHLGLLGGRLQLPFGGHWLLEADLAAALGAASPSPGSLGASGGLAVGGRASLGLQYMLDAALSVVARYGIDGWTADWTGTGTLDATIGQASLGELRQGVLFGVAYAL